MSDTYMVQVESTRKLLKDIAVELREYQVEVRAKRYGRAFACLNQAHVLMEQIVQQPSWEDSLTQ